MSLFALLGLALALGLRHAMDPDHVAAVAAITSRTRRLAPAAWLGLVWGLGHTLTVFVVGGAIVAFNLVVPPRVGLSLEFVVAIALIVIGALNLGRTPPHRHDDLARVPAGRAFVVGLVHGLAGSAAIALLVLATVRRPLDAALYLLVFGAGTLAGMVLVTTGFAAPISAASVRWPAAPRIARVATGLVSLVFGLWLAWQIGVVNGLFGTTPRWDPH